MSIRKYNKDHLKEHAGVTLTVLVRVDAPESGDPLVFWTQHDKQPCEVNLHPFSTGQDNHPRGGSNFIPFSGRSELIRQLAPTIEENLLWLAEVSVDSFLNSLRDWWRVLDSVEAAAAIVGQPMARVEDVRLLTQVHRDFAHRSGMSRQSFGKFRSIVDRTRIALGVRQSFWESPEDPKTEKHIPPQEQRDAIRFAVRGTCRSVLERWAQSDRLSQCDTEPTDAQEARLWRHVKYMQNIQRKTGKVLPTPDELCDGVHRDTLRDRGILLGTLRETNLPSHWDADAVWHLCVLNTGWNPSTLTTLDVTKKFLFDHFKDDLNDSHRRFVLSPQTYELVGEKERAGGKEQFITGQWKTQDGPGHLIKTYMERVEPLRKLLEQQLAQEKLKYEDMVREGAEYAARTSQFAEVNALEQGVRSVWLYVNRIGKVTWISNKRSQSGMINGKQAFFMDEVVEFANTQRSAQRANTNALRAKNMEPLLAPFATVPHVAAKDFRVWFADYVYRTSFGSILHLKRALNHSQLRTTSGYVDTTILNQEASDAARRFLNILVSELDSGRVDLTILAHLYRHGALSPEQEELLDQARALPRSRMNVACKDAHHPPTHIKATPDDVCDVQRCLLCLENAVLLPESFDGIAMRVEELRALQGVLPIETWAEDRYDIELKNNLTALRKFDLNLVFAARTKWAQAIARGKHFVPGLPLASSPAMMELV